MNNDGAWTILLPGLWDITPIPQIKKECSRIKRLCAFIWTSFLQEMQTTTRTWVWPFKVGIIALWHKMTLLFLVIEHH